MNISSIRDILNIKLQSISNNNVKNKMILIININDPRL